MLLFKEAVGEGQEERVRRKGWSRWGSLVLAKAAKSPGAGGGGGEWRLNLRPRRGGRGRGGAGEEGGEGKGDSGGGKRGEGKREGRVSVNPESFIDTFPGAADLAALTQRCGGQLWQFKGRACRTTKLIRREAKR